MLTPSLHTQTWSQRVVGSHGEERQIPSQALFWVTKAAGHQDCVWFFRREVQTAPRHCVRLSTGVSWKQAGGGQWQSKWHRG